MKRGFTMIELIFVIVILGILAAVAIPRLSATRDDAVVARSVSDIATAIQDIGAHYTARGTFGAIGAMTNVQFFDTNLTSGVHYRVSDSLNCITFSSAADGNLTVANSTSSPDTSNVCVEVRNLANDRNMITTHEFGGSRVRF